MAVLRYKRETLIVDYSRVESVFQARELYEEQMQGSKSWRKAYVGHECSTYFQPWSVSASGISLTISNEPAYRSRTHFSRCVN